MTERRRGRKPWVLKLGGSLAGSPLLRGWLDAIAGAGGRLVVVAGGGPFADAVRSTQRQSAFDDATAHRMAILAMEQYALMLAGLGSGLRPVASRTALLGSLRDGFIPVWLPSRMLLGRPDLAESWNVTADSLAAWLAADLDAACLTLVKSVTVSAPCAARELARLQTVDRAFPEILARCRCECRIVAAADYAAFSAALGRGAPTGTLVLPDLA